MRYRRACLPLACLALTACGDPVVDDRFRGEPMATFTGEVAPLNDRIVERPIHLRAAVFWNPRGLERTPAEALVEDRRTGRSIGSVPSAYTLHLFDAPAAMAPDTRSAIGHVLLYADTDGDGQRGGSEPFVGGVTEEAILYAATSLDAQTSPTRLPLAAGFHRVRLPMPCSPPPAITDPDDCGVDFDASCGPMMPCAAGVCLDAEAMPGWRDGTCAMPEPAGDGCRPANGALIAGRTGADPGYWVAGCADDADCAHQPGRSCDQGARACVPLGAMRVLLDLDGVSLRAYCRAAAPVP